MGPELSTTSCGILAAQASIKLVATAKFLREP